MKTALLAGIAAVALSAGSALASMTLVDSAAPGGLVQGTIPTVGTNEGMSAIFGANTGYGYFGATVNGAAGSYLVEYYGAEASNNNQFRVNGTDILFTTPGTAGAGVFGSLGSPLASQVVNFAGGALTFTFLLDSNPGAEITNAGNLGQPGPNFFASFNPLDSVGFGGTEGDSVWLFLDDGNQVDDNHDDMVIRITYQAVPEPATLGLLGAGLLGLGFAARRRKSA